MKGQVVKRGWFGMLVLALVLLQAAAGQALAQRPEHRFPGGRGGADGSGGHVRPMPQPPAGDQERGREADAAGQGAAGRLSPDQRRQLRRDIGAHGREIYGGGRRPER